MVPGPQAVKEGIIWSAWQLRLILPWLCPHSHSLGNHPKLTDTGAHALSQMERDYLSPVAFVNVFTQSFHHAGFAGEKVRCNLRSEFLSLARGGLVSNLHGLCHCS